MSDGDEDGEMERSNVYLPVKEKKIVEERRDMTISEACRETGLIPAARGEAVVEASKKEQLATEQWERTEDGILSVLAYLDNIAGDGGAVTMERVHSEFDAFREERGETIAEQVAEPVTEAVDEYESENREKYEDLLATMGDQLQSGTRVFEGHGKVKRAADLSDQTPAEVIEELKEHNPDVDDRLFTSGLEEDSRGGVR